MTGIQYLIDFTTFIAHVSQFTFSRSKTNGGDSHADGGNRVGAEIPKFIFGRFISENFMICTDTGLCEFMG